MHPTLSTPERPKNQHGNPVQHILQHLREADARLIKKHPWLDRNDAVAFGFFCLGLAIVFASALAWLMGSIPTLLTICLITLGMSILHELEHDLIHDLYLPHFFVRGFVMTTIWIVKASLDPWTRGRWHRWHHAMSGQEEDIEERLIGLGTPWGIKSVRVTLLCGT